MNHKEKAPCSLSQIEFITSCMFNEKKELAKILHKLGTCEECDKKRKELNEY